MKCLILFLCASVCTQEVPTPSSDLKPRNHNHHAYEDLNLVKPTKQGPVLFPNDAPPPPRPPLIVTSRPLTESIARSELADNTTVTSQSRNIVTSLRDILASQHSEAAQSRDRVSFVPFLARVKDYRPYVPSPSFDYQLVPTNVPYADLVKKSRLSHLQQDNRYDDNEEHTALPPIYKALSDHAAEKVFKIHKHKPNYQIKPPSTRHYQEDLNDDNLEYDQNQDYAFSYTVRDHKTGDDFSHSQHSSGSATNGEYRVRLPDGRMQIVSYTADENGYKADVRYDDEDKTDVNNHDNYRNKLDHLNEPVNYKTPNYKYVTVRPQPYVTPKQFVTPIHTNYLNNQQNDYSIPIDYTDRSNKNDYDIIDKKDTKPNNDKDYYQYPDVSNAKDYYTDYSSEYNTNYQPHKSKFNFVETKNVEINNRAIGSTVKPSFEELKDLLVDKNVYNTRQNYDDVASTPEATTERVVNIGGKPPNLYTNIKHSLPLYSPTPVPVYSTPKVVVATTPESYLVSTIASLKNKVKLGTKPVLSQDFINRINKYISFN